MQAVRCGCMSARRRFLELLVATTDSRNMKSIPFFHGAWAAMFLVCGCASPPERRGSAPVATRKYEISTRARGDGVVGSPSYQVGSKTFFIGYVRAYFSSTSPSPPRTVWYLDGERKGLVKNITSARFKAASRTNHTVSFTCAGDHRPPPPVKIDLLPYQKVSIPVGYR